MIVGELYFDNISNGLLYKQIHVILSHYLKTLDEDINAKSLDDESYIGNLLVLSEVLPLLTNKVRWHENIYLLIAKIDQKLFKYINALDYGMLQGLTGITYAMKQLSYSFPDMAEVYHRYENILFNNLDGFITYCNDNIDVLCSFHYDAISGLAGIGVYLLDIENQASQKLVKRILAYFMHLFKTPCKMDSPCWIIKGHSGGNSTLANGYVDFGLAHGIAGPMVFMAKAYDSGFATPQVLNTLLRLTTIYFNYYYLHDGIIYWPSQLSLENYMNRIVKEEIRIPRSSWCYGNVSILVALNRACKVTKLDAHGDFIQRNTLNIIHQNIVNHNLTAPILCHGFAGLLMFYLYAQRSYTIVDIDTRINEIVKIITQMFDTKYHYGFVNCVISSVTSRLETYEMYDLLNGPSGVMLALISAIKKDSSWEKIIFYDK